MVHLGDDVDGHCVHVLTDAHVGHIDEPVDACVALIHCVFVDRERFHLHDQGVMSFHKV